MDLSERRADLERTGLSRADLLDDPLDQFRVWLNDAISWDIYMPEAVVVSTVGRGGRPSSRHVLLRGLDAGFVFFTNYDSAKAADIAVNPVVSLCFPWAVLQRQVRVVGSVEVVSAAASDAYFASRPRGSQIGAWASPQSAEIPSREMLELAADAAADRYEGQDVPRPKHWGGYRVIPDEIEFWQGRPDRLHDRFRYTRVQSGITLESTPGAIGDAPTWHIDRLAP